MDPEKLVLSEVEAVVSQMANIIHARASEKFTEGHWMKATLTSRGRMSKLRVTTLDDPNLSFESPTDNEKYANLVFDLMDLQEKHEKELEKPWHRVIVTVYPDGTHSTELKYEIEDPTFFDFKKE